MSKQQKNCTNKLFQKFTCKNCNYSYKLPHKEFAGMNSELYCKKCNSLAFGLIRREIYVETLPIVQKAT